MSTRLDEHEVAARLADRAQLLDVGVPRWHDVERGMRRVRRRRRQQRAGVVAGVLASVVALGAGVQTGVLPYPSVAPALVLPASGGTSALASQPTKGSLAADEAWLRAFREHVAGMREDESGGESWQVPTPDAVTVLYAGDVAGHRLAAIEAPYRWGVVEAPQQVWFLGPEGAAAEQMANHGNSEPGDVMAVQFGPGLGYADSTADSGWLVLTPDARDVTLLGPPTYAADGSVARQESVLPATEPGVHLWSTAEVGAAATVRVTGYGESAWSSVGGEAIPPSEVVRAASPVMPTVSQTFPMLYTTAGLATGSAEPLVLWSGGPQSRRTAVLALRTASGALVVGSGHEGTELEEERAWFALDDVRVLPAQDPTDAAVAWQQSDMVWTTDEQGSYGSPVASEWVGVLGPLGAVRAELLDDTGSVVATTSLDEGGAVVSAPGAADVRFLDAGGRVVLQTNVVPWADDPTSTPLWDR